MFFLKNRFFADSKRMLVILESKSKRTHTFWELYTVIVEGIKSSNKMCLCRNFEKSFFPKKVILSGVPQGCIHAYKIACF